MEAGGVLLKRGGQVNVRLVFSHDVSHSGYTAVRSVQKHPFDKESF